MPMKKNIITLVSLLAATIVSLGQNHIAVQVAPHYALPDDWSTSSVELNVQLIRDIGDIIHLGLGTGIGTATPVKYYSMWDLGNTEKKEKVMYTPVFLRMKFDLNTNPSHAYFAIKAGTKLCSVQGFSADRFNPYVANISPAVGYDINVGSHKLGIEFVVDGIFGRYQQINYVYNDLLKKYMYDSFETKTDSFWSAYGIAVTFEF